MTATTKIFDVLRPPRTAKEVFEMLPEGTLAEVIDNTIYMAPSPIFEHQDIVGEIFAEMRAHVKTLKLGKCVVSPMDVYLDDANIVQPDIIYISNKNSKIILIYSKPLTLK